MLSMPKYDGRGRIFRGVYPFQSLYLDYPKKLLMTTLIKYLFVALLITASSCHSRIIVCKRPILPDVELSMNGDPFVARGIGRINPNDSLLEHAYMATLDTPTFFSFINSLGEYIKIPNDRINEIPVSIALYTNNSIHHLNSDSLTGILIIMVDTVKWKLHSLLFKNDPGKGFSEIEVFNNSSHYFYFNDLSSISPIVFDGANWAYFRLERKPALTAPRRSMFLRRSLFYKPLRKYSK